MIGEWFADQETGGHLERPELDRLRGAVRGGEVAKIYVWRIDRLTRSGIRDTLALLDEFRHGGARVASVNDGFSLDGPGADVVLAVIAWAAQMERVALGERISAARERVAAEGGRWGRPRRVDPSTLDYARRLQGEGRTIRQIAAAVKVPRATLAEYLSGKGRSERLAKRRGN